MSTQAGPAENAAKPSGSDEMKGLSIIGKVVGGFVMIWIISMSYYAFAFFALGMLPAIVAMIIDRGSGRFASQTVSACNFIGIMPFLFDIGMTYDKSAAAREMMTEAFTWMVIYGFAAIGMMLIFILPNITAIFFTIKAELKLKGLVSEQEELVDEWGEIVKKGGR